MKLPKLQEKINPVYAWLVFILAVAAIMRFYHYAAFSFSNDELSAINRLRFGTLRELVDKGFYVDGHPGGIQVMLWYWSKWFGISEISLRLPFVIFGILAVLFAFLTARQFFGAIAGLFSAAAIAFLEFPILYSQTARPYGSGLFFCLLMLWFWYRLINQDNENRQAKPSVLLNLAGYSTATALCMYNHYFSFLVAAIAGITGLFLIKRRMLPGYIVAGLAACLIFLPHLYITLNHLIYKGVGLWLGKPTPVWIAEHLLYIFSNQLWLALATTAIAIALAWINRKQIVKNKYRFVVLLLFLLPLATGYVYSLIENPVLQHPVLIFSFPFLLFFLFSYAGDRFRPVHSLLLAVFMAAGVFSTAVYGRYYQKQHYGEFRDVAHRILKAGEIYGKQNVTNIVSANNPYYIRYYFERQNDSTMLSMTNVSNDSLESLGKLVRTCNTPYLLYALTKPSPPEAADIIAAVYPFRLEHVDYGGLSELSLFSKNKPEGYVDEAKINAVKQITFEETPSDISPEKLLKGIAHSGNISMKVDPAMEYSPGVMINPAVGESGFRGILQAEAEAWVWFDHKPKDAVLVLSLEVPGKEPYIWKGAVIRYFADEGRWCRVIQTCTIPEKTDPSAVIKMYIWNKGKESFIVDDMRLTLKSIDIQ